jgi:hypothetical protein
VYVDLRTIILLRFTPAGHGPAEAVREQKEAEMTKLPINAGHLYRAVRPMCGETEIELWCSGYLNRQTGEIIFVYSNKGTAKDFLGISYAAALSIRRRREADLDAWLFIPWHLGDDSGIEDHLANFFKLNSIHPLLI